MRIEENIYFCNAEAMFFGKLISCGLIAKYKLGRKNKIFRCEIHCPEDSKNSENVIKNNFVFFV